MKLWQKLGIAAGIAIIGLVVMGFWARAKWRNMMYPQASPMPAAVSTSMPEVLARLESVLKTNAPHVLARLQAGLAAAEISRLEQQHHVSLPEEIKVIYQWHNGSVLDTNDLSGEFIPTHRFLPLEEALQQHAQFGSEKLTPLQWVFTRVFVGHRDSWICLLDDGAGDGYWYDLKRKPAEGAVFYNLAEGGYLFFPSAKNLMAGVAECYARGIIQVKAGSSPPELDEDFDRAQKTWEEFGVWQE